MLIVPGSLLELEWLKSVEGKQVLRSLLSRDGSRLKQYASLLDRPHLPSQIAVQDITYKVMVVGKTGVGKTSTVARLAGTEIPQVHNETPGLQTTVLYWPGKIRNLAKIVLFNIHFYDAGDTALHRYDHILPACRDKADGILFLFSYVDKSSFDEIPHLLTRHTDPKDGISKLIIGTKCDLHAQSEVTQRDIQDLENNWQIPVLKIRNSVNSHHVEIVGGGLGDVETILNTLCEHLWYRDVNSSKIN